MNTKIIQITSCNSEYGNYKLFALCEDGTIWVDNGIGDGFKQLNTN